MAVSMYEMFKVHMKIAYQRFCTKRAGCIQGRSMFMEREKEERDHYRLLR